ncbi:uncharacterized protein LOC132704092 isoform X2 [Cylas formicarius]|uniref:uncharacterized protein LOC132704092 isoform X2 n=1 Tax=Cylas formicarius TaxID=197179 RepID=UPI002958C590|nr:uncharacterized protein LOC132704092 isoform X2 [Cylas formicarius]
MKGALVNVVLLSRKIFVYGICVFLSAIIVNSKVNILPIAGLPFTLVFVTVWLFAMSATFVGLHKLLQYKEPVDFEWLNKIFFGHSSKDRFKPNIKVNEENIRHLVEDIDRNFISKWYSNISKDMNFIEESKVFIEEVLTRLIEVQLRVNNQSLVNTLLNIYLKHLKEFKRSLKRKEKYKMDIKELYRYSHICSTANNKPREFFLHQLTLDLLRHFINSELWNSLPCHILVSVLARKFTSYLLQIFSKPDVLNYLILNSVVSCSERDSLKLNEYGRISIIKYFDVTDSLNHQNLNFEYKDEGHGKQKDIIKPEEVKKEIKQDKTPVQLEKNYEIVLRRRKAVEMLEKDYLPKESFAKKTDPVKIYEPKGSTKTWRDSRDLACVSLGQDPLDALQLQSESAVPQKHRFCEVGVKAEEVRSDSAATAATTLFNEVMHITSMGGLKSSIKPILSDATERTLHNIKDLQESTVHKIGDFQVTDNQELHYIKYLHHLPLHTLLYSSVQCSVPHIQSKDEAAGVVEGILDFGRARFKKGLRLTGLQDNIENARATFAQVTKNPLTKLTRSGSQEKMSSAESVEESVWLNPLQPDSPVLDCVIQEVKQCNPRTSLYKPQRSENFSIPSISTEQPKENNSPDLEYEDTADLASSIAKLRSLLQQRSSESSLSTPAVSPMPDEYAQRAVESENTSDIEASEVDGVMPSFYKFCTKTASGVLTNTINTIKTALPGNNNGLNSSTERWIFKSELIESGLLLRMKKLLTERKEYCTLDKEIDTACEALDSVDFFQQSPVLSSLQFDDELEDLELKIPIIKTIMDIWCELLANTTSPLIQEPIVKALLLLFGSPLEKVIGLKIAAMLGLLVSNLNSIPDQTNTKTLSMDFDEYITILSNACPDSVKTILGSEVLQNALSLFVSSIQEQDINQDIVLQIIELISMKLIEENTQVSPPVSA